MPQRNLTGVDPGENMLQRITSQCGMKRCNVIATCVAVLRLWLHKKNKNTTLLQAVTLLPLWVARAAWYHCNKVCLRTLPYQISLTLVLWWPIPMSTPLVALALSPEKFAQPRPPPRSLTPGGAVQGKPCPLCAPEGLEAELTALPSS